MCWIAGMEAPGFFYVCTLGPIPLFIFYLSDGNPGPGQGNQGDMHTYTRQIDVTGVVRVGTSLFFSFESRLLSRRV